MLTPHHESVPHNDIPVGNSPTVPPAVDNAVPVEVAGASGLCGSGSGQPSSNEEEDLTPIHDLGLSRHSY
ncbi:hypothetical protein EB796_020723 [Bugula neritina]|uniref:Uncharacterized protein n=1 Tax=Bugula neritina TaxID=10212 RepID=A0A7J7J404_BUGNE|nr:hypothetical protein EB796_020723 [Bugula neritina]